MPDKSFYWLGKFGRFLGLIVSFALITAMVLLVAAPAAGKAAIIMAAAVVALLVALYDLGLFREELEI